MTTGPRIYLSGDTVWLVFDQSPRTDKTHSISVPANEKGWAVILHILRERERSPFVPKEFMATKEAPIQHMVDEWLRNGGQIKTPKKAAPQELTIEDLDL